MASSDPPVVPDRRSDLRRRRRRRAAPLQPSQPSVRFWPADSKHVPTGLRNNVVTKDARFTTEDFESHLLSPGEFCAMYLFVLSNALWPDTLRAWRRLHGPGPVRTGYGHLAAARGYPGSVEDRIRAFVKVNCEKQDDSFRAHRATIKKVRDRLPKVRRARYGRHVHDFGRPRDHRRLARLAEMIDKKLLIASGGDAEVVEEGAHVEAKRFVVAINGCPGGWLASDATGA